MRTLNIFLFCFFLASIIACKSPKSLSDNVVTSDIDLFWKAYDQIVLEKDSLIQATLLDSMYLQKGTIGLKKIVEARNYTAGDYLELIQKYPKFWESIRGNTLKAKDLANDLNEGILKLKAIYPDLKPAKIYFTVGAMRTNGTTKDSLVLIGSELAMGDPNTNISEFEGGMKEWLVNFYGTNPMESLVLLNVHEYVHTQQDPTPDLLLYQVLHEGIAEFVSVKAMGVPSSTPAIEFGKMHPEVKAKFEEELFFERSYEWIWSSAPNDFDMRDLGYYIGYSIAENLYDDAWNKERALKQLIELDFSDTEKIDALIDSSHFFSKKISILRDEFETKRPKVDKIVYSVDGVENFSLETNQISIVFSQPMAHEGYFEFGPLGEDAVIRYKEEIGYADDNLSYSFKIEALEPNKQYQLVVGMGFVNEDQVPLKPYMIEFTTGGK